MVDARFVIKALEKAGGNELDQVLIALVRFAEQEKMVAPAHAGLAVYAVLRNGPDLLATIEPAPLGHIDLAANDGFYVALVGFVEEICRGKDIAVVRDSHGRHAEARCGVEKLGDLARAVEKTVIRVNVEMNKLLVTHGPRF